MTTSRNAISVPECNARSLQAIAAKLGPFDQPGLEVEPLLQN